MPLTAATASQYFRQAGQQQVLYAYWLDAGDVERARLAMNVANWYYQQLGIPYYLPTDLPGYAPQPTSPDAAVAAAASLPLDRGQPVNAGGSGSGGSGSGLHPHDISGSGFAGDAPYGSAQFCLSYPDDPICTGGGYIFSGGAEPSAPVYISNPVTITINQNGATLADVASRISGALATAAAAIATAVDSVLAVAIAGIQHALNAIGNELASVFHLLARLAGYILNFLKALMLGVIHALVAAVEAIGKMLKDVFAHGIMPALQALQKARDWLIKIYERFLRPLLIVLQDLRKILAILKAFHVGFATKLDNVLADIQSKVSTPLLYLLRYTNTIANYINLILDARLFIQRPLFLASLNAYKGKVIALQLNAISPPPDPARIADSFASSALPTREFVTDDFDRLMRTGHAPMGLTVNFYVDVLKQYLEKGF